MTNTATMPSRPVRVLVVEDDPHRVLLRRALGAGALVVALLTASSAGAGVTEVLKPTEAAQTAEQAERVGTPRGAVQGYFAAAQKRDYERAAGFLDLGRVPAAERAFEGPELARKLWVVLDRTLLVDPEMLSDEPEGRRDDGLLPSLERVGVTKVDGESIDIVLRRSVGEGGTAWKFSAATVTEIPALYHRFGDGALAEMFPPFSLETPFFAIALWQWIGLALVLALAWLGAWLGALAVALVLRPILRSARTSVDERLLLILAGPLRLLVGLVLFVLGLLPLALSVVARQVLGAVAIGLAIAAATRLLIRVVDVAADLTLARLAAAGRAAAPSMVTAGARALKVLAVVLAAIAVLHGVGVNVTGLLAGLGLGGLAIALAAQKTVENLFGGASLVLDQPVRVGDFCRFGDTLGTVEEIGLRSTRVRTLNRTLVTVPNAEFAGLTLENFEARDRIWFNTTLGLRYETTPDQLRWVLVEVRKLLYARPKVSPDPARIRFVGFGAYSLDLEVFAYVRTTSNDEFLAVREDLYLRIMDIVGASGTGFAFPSQTAYLASDSGVNGERTKEVEGRVRAWRQEGRLPLPDVPPEAIAELGDTLEYPPTRGSGRAGRSA